MRAHSGKCYLLLRSETLQVVTISGTIITSSTAETLLGIITDLELNFDNHQVPCVTKWVEKLMHLVP